MLSKREEAVGHKVQGFFSHPVSIMRCYQFDKKTGAHNKLRTYVVHFSQLISFKYCKREQYR